jgi:hypothetical protein
MSPFDAILVPGGGLTAEGRPHPWVCARLDKALETEHGEYIVALSGPTPHKAPPLDRNGFPVFECDASARYLIERGFPRERILAEWVSRDTIGNAFFSRVLHAEPREWKNLLVITSAFHMPRTREVFDFVFNLSPKRGFKLGFESTPDAGLSDSLLAARKQREEESLEKFREGVKGIGTLAGFHEWLFTRHEAYAAGLKPARAKGAVLETY